MRFKRNSIPAVQSTWYFMVLIVEGWMAFPDLYEKIPGFAAVRQQAIRPPMTIGAQLLEENVNY